MILQKMWLEQILTNANEAKCNGKNGGKTRETSYRGCIMRKVLRKEVATAGRLTFSGLCIIASRMRK